ncbi:MAG: response regulator [Shinella sp.]|nr:response regulator [Shinella sp.]
MNDVASSDANIRGELFEAACDILAAAVLVYDRNDRLVFASRQALRYFPIRPDLLKPGTRLRDILGAIFDAGIRYGIPGDARHRPVNREEWISARISAHWREQYDAVERLGRERWINFRKRRLPNGYSISTLTDISEHKKQEEQWHADTQRIALTEDILETLPGPLLVKDRNLAYIAVNKAFCAIHGVGSENILGRTIWDLAEVEDAERIERSDRMVLESGAPFSVPEHIVRADGSHLYVMTRKYRIGTPGRYLLVTFMDDVTELAAPDGARSGTFSLSATAEEFVEAQNCFDPVSEAEKRMLLEQVPPEAAPRRAQRVLVATPDPVTADLTLAQLRSQGADCCAVRSAVEHDAFLSMAQACGVKIDLVLVDARFGGCDRILSGRDGIPAKLLAAGETLPEAQDGAEEQGAADGAAAPDGSVPQLALDDWYIATGEDVSSSAVGDVDVLVAEDNRINQFVFSQILEGMGVTHRIAENGEEAVALWRRHQPRLILMDISMPVKNGLDAAREIRQAEEALGFRTPIVAVTALALNIDTKNCLEAGMDDYITKPVSPDMIEAVYRRHVLDKLEKSVA